MADLGAVQVQVRAYWATAAERLRHARARARRNRHVLTSALLVVVGLGGGLGFASLIGEWCLGLTGLAECAGLVYFGLGRDDQKPLPRHGERTVQDVLEWARRLP